MVNVSVRAWRERASRRSTRGRPALRRVRAGPSRGSWARPWAARAAGAPCIPHLRAHGGLAAATRRLRPCRRSCRRSGAAGVRRTDWAVPQPQRALVAERRCRGWSGGVWQGSHVANSRIGSKRMVRIMPFGGAFSRAGSCWLGSASSLLGCGRGPCALHLPMARTNRAGKVAKPAALVLKQASRAEFASPHHDHQRVGTSLRPTAARS